MSWNSINFLWNISISGFLITGCFSIYQWPRDTFELHLLLDQVPLDTWLVIGYQQDTRWVRPGTNVWWVMGLPSDSDWERSHPLAAQSPQSLSVKPSEIRPETTVSAGRWWGKLELIRLFFIIKPESSLPRSFYPPDQRTIWSKESQPPAGWTEAVCYFSC